MGEKNTKFMEIENAIEIVLGLARENILEDQQIQDDGMEKDQGDQRTACDTVEDFFVNTVTEGVIDLKWILMRLENQLVIDHKYVPTLTNVRAHTAAKILMRELSREPSTDSIAVLTNFLNASEEARLILQSLGIEWSMPDESQGEKGNHPQSPRPDEG